VPSTFCKPNLIETLSKLYDPSSQTIVSVDGSKIIMTVTTNSIGNMLLLPIAEPLIHEEILMEKANSWSPREKKAIMRHFLLDITPLPNLFPVKSTSFAPISRQVIYMIASILGCDDDSTMDETILGLLNDISPSPSFPPLKYNFIEFMSNAIHVQLCGFHDFKMFHYQSYLMFMLLYSQYDYFKYLNLKL
jgi:hypothetical protein